MAEHTHELAPAAVRVGATLKAGGLKTLRAVAAPFPALRFIPTGGITPENAGRYLEQPSVFAIGGSWLAPSRLIDAGRFDEITRLARDAATLAAAP